LKNLRKTSFLVVIVIMVVVKHVACATVIHTYMRVFP